MHSARRRFRSIVLIIGDLACFALGLCGALILRYGWGSLSAQFPLHRFAFGVLAAFWMFSFFTGGLYSIRSARNNRPFFKRFFQLFGLNALIAAVFFYFVPYFTITPKIVLFFDLGITLSLLFAWRIFFNTLISRAPLRLAILGSGPEVDELIDDIKKHPNQGYLCVLHLSKPEERFLHLLKERRVEVVTVAVNWRSSHELQQSLFECIALNIQFVDFVDFYEHYFQKIPLAVIDRSWFLENINEPEKAFFSSIKRFFDIIGAVGFGLVGMILAPFIFLSLVINSPGGFFYSQVRVGQFGKSFRIHKFRTLKRDADSGSVTPVGRFLRASHLDELPQVWNIIHGDMSFVGPRPEQQTLVNELKKEIPFYMERLLVRPGITGWAQLHEPHATADQALSKLQYDLFYVKHRSILLDAEIVLKTIAILLRY